MTDTYSPLTATTWATLAANHAYLSRNYATAQATRLYWPDTCDLAYELADMHANLTVDMARVLVDLCVSQIPVVLTWTTYLGGSLGTETTTAAVIIEYVGTAAIYVHYCGFGHWVQLSSVTDAHVFKTTRTYA